MQIFLEKVNLTYFIIKLSLLFMQINLAECCYFISFHIILKLPYLESYLNNFSSLWLTEAFLKHSKIIYLFAWSVIPSQTSQYTTCWYCFMFYLYFIKQFSSRFYVLLYKNMLFLNLRHKNTRKYGNTEGILPCSSS